MSKSFWIGLILVIAGLVVALTGLSYVEDRDKIGIGDASVTIEDREHVPNWVGWVVAGAGLVLMVTGIRGRGGRNVTVIRDDHTPHTT